MDNTSFFRLAYWINNNVYFCVLLFYCTVLCVITSWNSLNSVGFSDLLTIIDCKITISERSFLHGLPTRLIRRSINDSVRCDVRWGEVWEVIIVWTFSGRTVYTYTNIYDVTGLQRKWYTSTNAHNTHVHLIRCLGQLNHGRNQP